MSKEAMKLALEALNNSVDLVVEDAYNAEKLYGNYPTRQRKVGGLKILAETHKDAIKAIEEALAKQEQGEPQPTLYVKDIDGNFHLHKEKGHTENCAALGDDCCPENHLPPSRVGVGDDYSISEPAGYIDHADGQVVWKSTKPANGSLLYTTPQQRKPLTREVIDRDFHGRVDFVRQVEAAHEIKG